MVTTDLESLRKNAHKVVSLPERAQHVVEGYQRVRVGKFETACPYHINPGLRSTDRALVGKGSPREIEALAKKYFKLYDMHPRDSVQLREFLTACGIGIDCSGFAAWVLDATTRELVGRPIWKCLQFPGLRRSVISKLRPIHNISANLLTGPVNSLPVTNLNDVRPGDLLRLAGWHHVAVIIEVGLDTVGRASYFVYAQSSCMYGAESGVRTGYAVISKPEGPLGAQEWHDDYPRSVIEELIADGGTESRAVRLKALAAVSQS